MWKLTAVFSVLLLCAFCLQAQSQTAEAKPPAAKPGAAIPPDAIKMANPVKPTAASIAAGKKKYGYDCAMCHGENGDGKGDLAVDMKLKMLDYRDAATQKITDGEMFYVIKNGNGGDMPSGADRLKDEDIWSLVNYIRTFAKNSPAAKAKSDAP